VVVLDISLQVRDGIEATERIRASVPGTCVLVLSAQTDGDVIARAFAAGAHGYVFKSAAASELREAIVVVAQGKRFIGTGVAERIIDGYLDERDNDNVLAGLTEQERQILQLIADGKSNSETAVILHLSTRTVEAYRAKIMAHLNLENVAALVKFAIRHGLVSLD
jgi:DNA-binding NarL/FixJ family response regulator